MAGVTVRNQASAASAAAANSYNGATWSVLAGDELLVAVVNSKATTPDTPTLSGRGLNWVQVATVAFSTIAASTLRLTVFRSWATANDNTNVTASFGGVNQLTCSISEAALTGTAFGTSGVAAVVQSPTNRADSATTATATLAAYARTLNSAIAFIAIAGTAAMTPEAGWSQVNQIAAGTASNALIQFRNDATDTTPTATWTGAVAYAEVAVELRSAMTVDADVGTAATAEVQAGYLQSRTPLPARLDVGVSSGSGGGSARIGRWNPPQPRRHR